jgi:hypothetical protein
VRILRLSIHQPLCQAGIYNARCDHIARQLGEYVEVTSYSKQVVANDKSQSEKEVTLETVLDIEAAKVFYDGLLTEPRLDHPEGLAIHRDGSI